MEKKPLVSVIVPMYNAAATLPRCVGSLTRQTCKELEILLIDDGSEDESAKLAEEYAKKDGRIRLLRQANAGAGVARNLGLSESTGDYICFVDADDYVSDDYIGQMLAAAQVEGADLVVTNPIFEFEEQPPRVSIWYEAKEAARDKAGYYRLALQTRDGMQLIPPWGKLIRAELAKSARFPDMKFCEDAVYVLELLEKAPLLLALPYAGYHYVQGKTSLTAAVPVTDPLRVVSALVFNRQMYRRYRETDGNVRAETANAYARRVYIVLLSLAKNGDEKRYQTAKKHLSKDVKAVLREKGIEPKVWAVLKLFAASPETCWKALRALVKS